MKTPEPRCCIEILSRNDHCSIGYCRRCNLFHVDLGAVSIKLHALQLHALAGGFDQALHVFKRSILTGKGARALREIEEPMH